MRGIRAQERGWAQGYSPRQGGEGQWPQGRSVKVMGRGVGRGWGPGKSQRGIGQRREEGSGESNPERRVSSMGRLAGPEWKHPRVSDWD